MLWNLCDAKVKAQVWKRVEKSGETQRLTKWEFAKHKDGKGKLKAVAETTYCYSI